MSTVKDLACLAKSLKLIIDAQIKLQKETLSHICKTSSVPPLLQQTLQQGLGNIPPKNTSLGSLTNDLKDGADRISVVVQGLKVFAQSVGTGKRY